MARQQRRVIVTGDDETRRAFHRMADRAEDMGETDVRAAEGVARRMRAYVPKQSGRLLGTIDVLSPNEPGEGAAVVVGDDLVPYAGVINYGWPARNIADQPFMTDAVEDERDNVVDLYGEQVDALVRRFDVEAP